MPRIIENLEGKIIEESKKLLLKSSYKDMNMRDIAKACNIATGTLYNYFPNKEELVAVVFKSDWYKTLDLIDFLKESKEPFREKLRKIYLSIELFLDTYRHHFYDVVREKSYSKGHKNVYNNLYLKMEQLLQVERDRKNISSNLSNDKLAHFIISNLMYLSKNKYITFDELIDNLNI